MLQRDALFLQGMGNFDAGQHAYDAVKAPAAHYGVAVRAGNDGLGLRVTPLAPPDKIARALKEQDATISLEVDGVLHQGALLTRLDGETLSQSPLQIINSGNQQVDAVVTVLAPPAQSLPAGGNGFSITRTYYTLDGQATDPTSVSQNERFVVVLNIEDMSQWQSRVMVTDLLPSGFEIDNPSLVSSADLSNFNWLENTEAAHLEFRDDRFVAAFDRSAGEKSDITLAYVVRAVTPGLYTHPAASVEDMYRPQFSARTATGMMEIFKP